jgi:hypothetical protein
MKNKILVFVISILFSASLCAQKKELVVRKAPKSVYTFNTFKIDKNSYAAINKRLGFTAFKFIRIYFPDLDFNSFESAFNLNTRSVFEFKNMKEKPIIYKLDDLARYQNNKLAREINYKNDPSQWNLHRIENRIQPYFLKKEKK